ncbi:MAG: CDP-diacylglycerol--glycerol-3-phosphate 3-phosphatidyltransferase [Phormidesmis priestleyi Ana]|uniref:CDP-diacylglycerol--glycerol-3-phosphate 3-phosphatidyltransferase n=1 Tax=Phormidesmis priestleyi Ana TaxID=1666911 RepID=A0A0P8DJ47_9CYAN|nr:MAG: CDP-diacylglycerol--glycerol-3-phosphate 3-phosphatidyltransferase [Phormidesmis priestleyi Ana]
MNLPTWITLSRLLGVPIVLVALLDPTDIRRWISVVAFVIFAGTDWLDGYLARKLNQVTELGKFLDPLVDKLLVMAPLMALVGLGEVPAWGVFLILARELTISGWRVNPTFQQGKVPGAGIWGKAKTVVQIIAIALLLAPLSGVWQTAGIILFWVALVLTWVSGLLYLLPAKSS